MLQTGGFVFDAFGFVCSWLWRERTHAQPCVKGSSVVVHQGCKSDSPCLVPHAGHVCAYFQIHSEVRLQSLKI